MIASTGLVSAQAVFGTSDVQDIRGVIERQIDAFKRDDATEKEQTGATMAETDTTLSLAAKLATSYVENNKVAPAELPALIGSLHEALGKLESGEDIREPAVAINKSVKRNEIICLECGKGHKMLKRHLTSAHGLAVEGYRVKWGLAGDYPLVAPNYAKQRSEIAKKIGLGR